MPRRRDPPAAAVHADLVLDRDRFEVTRDGGPVPLTRVEFRLLETILAADGRVLTRDQLLDAVYGDDGAEILDRTIDVHIGRLRDKLGDDPDHPRYVATVRGVGYRAARTAPGRLARGSRDRPPDRARRDRLGGGRGGHRGGRRRGGRCRDLHGPDGRGRRLGRARPRHVRPVGHDRRPRGRDRGGRRQPAARDRPVADARPAAGRDRQRGPPDRRGRLRGAGPARGPRRAGQPRRLVQPDGREPRAPGGDAARLHRQRGARAAHAADQPAGLPRGAARRRHHRRPRDLRVALGRGGAARPAVALARCARRGRRGRPADAGRARPRDGDPQRPRARAARARAGGPHGRRRRARSTCRRGPTRTSSPRCSPTCCPTPRGTRPPAARSRSAPSGDPADLLVSIENSGEGIPPEDLDRVFERFYRVEKSRDRARGGAGIGLAIVKQLVELAGGRVGAESASGTTRFWFSLPA